ncbi:UNVERIFIED_CONTAM: hypothetical protein Sradi_2302000 [Sesamum radiatum]|uniref:Secreted protein n=1 Tax=Sesamum radiatum TaxID=300843 RepID=A0AAW2T4R3_SESRA
MQLCSLFVAPWLQHFYSSAGSAIMVGKRKAACNGDHHYCPLRPRRSMNRDIRKSGGANDGSNVFILGVMTNEWRWRWLLWWGGGVDICSSGGGCGGGGGDGCCGGGGNKGNRTT